LCGPRAELRAGRGSWPPNPQAVSSTVVTHVADRTSETGALWFVGPYRLGRAMATIRIREYRPTDHSFVVDLSDRTLREFRRMDPGGEPSFFLGKAAQWFEVGLRSSWAKRSLFYVAEFDGEPAGYVIAGPANGQRPRAAGDRRPPRRVGEIYELHVVKRLRRKGVGTSMLTAAEQELSREGFGEVILGHLARNSVAAKLYESTGYRPRWVVQGKRLRWVRGRRSESGGSPNGHDEQA
jgi:ribosomal protein S18 acetylase RimI-like enzyme